MVALIVPKRLRAEWREEWEGELRHRERVLATWDGVRRRRRAELLRRSAGAFWDALWLQRQRWEDEMVQDLRFGLRILMKNPAPTCVAVAMLALGIGANTAVFSFVNALLLRPLAGVDQPERLVQIGRQYPDKNYISDSSYPDYLDLRAQNTVVSGPAAIVPMAFHVSSRGETGRVEGELVTGNYFEVLGATAVQGRLISAADDREGAEPIAILSSRLWRSRFGAAADIVGTTVTVNGQPFAVAGVVREPFAGIKIGTPRDIWIPLAMVPRFDPDITMRFANRRA